MTLATTATRGALLRCTNERSSYGTLLSFALLDQLHAIEEIGPEARAARCRELRLHALGKARFRQQASGSWGSY